jgi:hypothetical protein
MVASSHVVLFLRAEGNLAVGVRSGPKPWDTLLVFLPSSIVNSVRRRYTEPRGVPQGMDTSTAGPARSVCISSCRLDSAGSSLVCSAVSLGVDVGVGAVGRGVRYDGAFGGLPPRWRLLPVSGSELVTLGARSSWRLPVAEVPRWGSWSMSWSAMKSPVARPVDAASGEGCGCRLYEQCAWRGKCLFEHVCNYYYYYYYYYYFFYHYVTAPPSVLTLCPATWIRASVGIAIRLKRWPCRCCGA